MEIVDHGAGEVTDDEQASIALAQQLMAESSSRSHGISPSIITSGFGKIQQILVSSLQRSAEERKFVQIEDLGARRR